MARPSGAVSFARWAIDEFGKVVNDQATVRVSQAELARCYGVSASTVGWYIAELGEAVLQRRPLVFDLSLLEAAGTPRESAVEFAGLAEAFGRLAAGIDRLAAGSRGSVAASSRFLNEAVGEDLLSAAVGSDGWAADSRGELDEVLAPLVELAHQRGLIGMVHPDGVRAALAGYAMPDIEGAVARIAEDIENGASIRRPFGVLAARAAEGDTSLFRPIERRPSAPVVTLVPRSMAETAVDEPYETAVCPVVVPDVPDELVAELDREAARQVAERFPAVAEKMLANAPLRRALVASLWKERWSRQSAGGADDRARVS